jgi:hypothetical protein
MPSPILDKGRLRSSRFLLMARSSEAFLTPSKHVSMSPCRTAIAVRTAICYSQLHGLFCSINSLVVARLKRAAIVFVFPIEAAAETPGGLCNFGANPPGSPAAPLAQRGTPCSS